VRRVEIPGHVNDAAVIDGVAVFALGYDGVQTIPIED